MSSDSTSARAACIARPACSLRWPPKAGLELCCQQVKASLWCLQTPAEASQALSYSLCKGLSTGWTQSASLGPSSLALRTHCSPYRAGWRGPGDDWPSHTACGNFNLGGLLLTNRAGISALRKSEQPRIFSYFINPPKLFLRMSINIWDFAPDKERMRWETQIVCLQCHLLNVGCNN